MRDPSLTLPEPPPELAALSKRLCRRIAGEIESSGPISFARYMQLALYEPGLGYYVNGLHKFGVEGDFVTAPEQGSLFAEGLARQFNQLAAELPADWTLLEIGPGSGALAAALLPRLEPPPARYLLLETSAPLRETQAQALFELPGRMRDRVEWIDRPPDQAFSGVIVANEVIDALPVDRFRVTADGIEQARVTRSDGGFGWAWGPPADRVSAAVGRVIADLDGRPAEGYESEICPDLAGWLDTVTRSLATGLVLLIDYGYPRREYYHPDRSSGTLVCHYRHRAHFDPFVWPGLTDISAFVDFTALAEAADARNLEVAGFTTQAGFLLGLGVHEMVESTGDQPARLKLAGEFKRLTLPGEMGEKFKVMALTRGVEADFGAFRLADHLYRL